MMYSTLIDAPTFQTWLEAPTQHPHVVVLDCQADIQNPAGGLAAYLDAHIPGALHADLDRDLAAPAGTAAGGGGRHPLPDSRHLLENMRAWGIHNHTQVVVYDRAGGAFAARAWWCLRHLGHRAVAVLDGGLAAFLGSQSNGPALAVATGTVSARPSLTRIATVAEITDRVSNSNNTNLLDARDAARFAGEHEPIDAEAGHIPGASCLPFQGNLDQNQKFLSPQLLAERFSDANAETVCYCGSGVTAAHNILAMVHAGCPEPALYPGSWSGWIEDPARPRAQLVAPS